MRWGGSEPGGGGQWEGHRDGRRWDEGEQRDAEWMGGESGWGAVRWGAAGRGGALG